MLDLVDPGCSTLKKSYKFLKSTLNPLSLNRLRARGLEMEAGAFLSLHRLGCKVSHMSHSLNSLKGGYMGDYMGDYYRGY